MNRKTKRSRKHIRKLTLPAAVAVLILLALAGCKDFSFFNELGVKGGLTITPASMSILTDGIMSFNAYGGNGDYVFSIVSGNHGTIDPVSGVYTAPSTACNDVVMVTDGTNLSATATVSVVTTLDALEINPKVATLSPGSQITFVATGGNDSSYDYSFDTNNSGGTINTSTGLYTAGPTTGVGDTIVVTDGDLTVCAIPANVSIVAATSDVNYAVTADTFPATADAGAALSGTFTVTNVGTGNGNKPVSWWLYLSDDGIFGGDGEVLVASNNSSKLNAGDSVTVTPNTGSWPVIGGTYTLFVMVSAEDDMTHSDNIYKKTDSDITLTVPDVDYRVTSITNTSENHVGESISGNISLDNVGLDDGITSFTLNLYVSTNDTVDVGDTLVFSTSDAGLPGDDPSPTAPSDYGYTATWPSSPGSYYLVAAVVSADDAAAGNDTDNTTAVGPYTVHYRDVDYLIPLMSHLSGTGAGSIVTGEFELDNVGTDDGLSDITWKVYASTNDTVGVGDALIATDTITGGMSWDESIRTIGFTGAWPFEPDQYYLVVEVSAFDETQAGKDGNNEKATGSWIDVVAADVDYYADTISAADGDAGGPLSCNFTLNNGGTDPSGDMVSWNLYVSANTTLDAGDYLADYGTAGPLGATPDSVLITPPGAAWPATPGDYYLIVEIESTEDAAAGKTANDVAASPGTFNVAAPDVNYTVDQVNFVLAGSTYVPDGPVNGNFVYKNIGTSNGTQPVSWEAYASLDTILDAGDVLIESGSGLPPLGATGATSGSIPFTGSWPLDYGKYFLLVRVMSSEEVDPADNTGATGTTEAVGYFDESLYEPNNDYTGLSDAYDLGVTFQPGMSIELKGTMSATDMDEVMVFNTGNCSMITFAVTYASSKAQIEIFVMDGPNSFIDGVSGTPGSISLNWIVDAAGVKRWLNLDNYGDNPAYNGTYTCVVTGN
jgi:hypothetical protein